MARFDPPRPTKTYPVRWPNAVSGHVTGFCREIRGFLTWPWSIWPSEVATQDGASENGYQIGAFRAPITLERRSASGGRWGRVRWPNAVSGHVTGFCRELRGFLRAGPRGGIDDAISPEPVRASFATTRWLGLDISSGHLQRVTSFLRHPGRPASFGMPCLS